MDDALRKSPFTRTWALYPTPPPPPPNLLHELRFEGSDWATVLQDHGEDVREAVHMDAVEALRISRSDVVDVRLTPSQQALFCDVKVRRIDGMVPQDSQRILEDYGFPRTWALYCPTAKFQPVSKHFEGDWSRVANEKPRELREAFAADTSRALGVYPADVEVTNVRHSANGMTVDSEVRGCPLEPQRTSAVVQDYPYPAVSALYIPPERQVSGDQRFGGELWSTIVDENDRGVVRAFREDASSAAGVPIETVEVTGLDTSANGLRVNYALTTSDRASDSDIRSRVNASRFPSVWNLYRRAQDAARMRAADRESREMERRFPGDDWDLVLDGQRPDAEAAFRKGVSDVTGVPPSNVIITGARLGSLIMNYKVRGAEHEDDELHRRVGDHSPRNDRMRFVAPSNKTLHPLFASPQRM